MFKTKSDFKPHQEIITKMKGLLPFDDDITILKKSLINYRQGKGLRLSDLAFRYLKSENLYEFQSFANELGLYDMSFTMLDTYSDSPFYVDHNFIYVSDQTHAFSLSLTDSIKNYLDSLRKL